MSEPLFKIDEINSDEQHCFVDVWGRGTVVINAADEGIVIDIFPLHVVDESVASTWAHYHDLLDEGEEIVESDPTFTADHTFVEDCILTIKVAGRGDVEIFVDNERISVNIFPKDKPHSDSVAYCGATMAELTA